MACIMGQDLMVFCGGKSIALATSHTFTISGATVSCSTKDNGGGEWETNEMGLLSFEMSTENLVGDERKGIGFDELYDIMAAKKPVELIFASKATIAAKGTYYEAPEGGWTPKDSQGYKAKALITNLSLNAPNGEHATMSATFTGTGAIQKLNTAAVMSVGNDGPGVVLAASAPASSSSKK